MVLPASKYISSKDYLEAEIVSEAKHEYFDGSVIAMAGATANHNRIVAHLISAIDQFLKNKNCEVFPSDLRVSTPLFTSYMYPDVSIVCGDTEKRKEEFDTITNPSVIIEVMSPSTEDRDLGFKFWYYLQIPTLKEYILVDSATYSARSIVKQTDDTFKMAQFDGLNATLTITTIGMQLPLQDIYWKVYFEQ